MKIDNLTEIKFYMSDDKLIAYDGKTYYKMITKVYLDSRTYSKQDEYIFEPIEMEGIK